MPATKASSDDTGADQKPNSNQISDIAKPGSSPASATSRPIIGHRSIMQDPMVAPSNPEETAKEDEEKTTVTDPSTQMAGKGKVIMPAAGSELETNQPEPADTAAVSSEPEASESAVATDEPPKKSLEEAAVDAYADEIVKRKKKPTKEDEQKLAEIQKHIEEKTYFVPVGQVKKRRNKRRFLIFMLILILLAGIYLVLDAEILDTDITLPFDLIK